jgi:hypothetical protein
MATHKQYLLSHSCLQHNTAADIFVFFQHTQQSVSADSIFRCGQQCCFLIRFGHFPVGPPATIKLMGNCYSLCDLYPGRYYSNQVTCYLSSVLLHTAAVGTVWSLLGSTRNGQAVLYTFQKTLNPVGRTFSLSMREFVKRW